MCFVNSKRILRKEIACYDSASLSTKMYRSFAPTPTNLCTPFPSLAESQIKLKYIVNDVSTSRQMEAHIFVRNFARDFCGKHFEKFDGLY